MESKKLLIILVLIVVIGGGLIYFYQNGFSFPFLENNTPAEENTPEESNGTEEPAEEPEDTVLEKGGFSVLLPGGWKEIASPDGVSLMITKEGEEFSDPKIKEIGFQSYVAVSQGDSKEKTWDEYIEYTKEIVLGMLGQESSILSEKDTTVNGKQAYAMDFEATYSGVELKGQVVIVKAEGTVVWGMSFNTTKDKWEGYKDAFSRMAESFDIK